MSNFELKIDMNQFNGVVQKFQKGFEGKLILWIRKWLALLLEELKRNTPEDTKEMLGSYKIIDVTKKWNSFVWVIGNTAEHAIYVEFWVDWRIYNYHKPKWSTFYSGVGNRTFQRSIVAMQDKIYKIILETLW